MKKAMIPLAAVLLAATAVLAGMWMEYSKSMQKIEKQGGSADVYEKHYVMISEDSSPLWQSVYRSAKETAAQENIYLEWVGADSLADYSAADCMEIAVAARVDGIILYPDGSQQIREQIDGATEQGIPVVTVLNDDSKSSRVSFVGVNSYQMGQIYGEQVLSLLKPGRNTVRVLMGKTAEDLNNNLMYAQMNRTLEWGKAEGQEVDISICAIDSSASFDAEEVVRDIFVNSQALPDILVCLDPISTECACQAAVDYNEVGNVDIIGSYATDNILEAVRKGILATTVSIDTEEIGRYSVNALSEYLELGYVSNYFNVNLKLVTIDNLGQFLSEQQDKEE